jgi:zinc/manganese transport system substrate-binding protein
MGHVHPAGNPHFWLSPVALAQASEEVADTLARIDPEKAEDYRRRQKAFVTRMNELQTSIRIRFEKAGVTGSKARFLEYHREFAYFAHAFGLESVGSLEEKPGVSPSAGRLVNVASQAKSEGGRIVLATTHGPRRLLARFEELSGVPVQSVPVSIEALGEPKDYPALLARIEEAIVSAAARVGQTAK